MARVDCYQKIRGDDMGNLSIQDRKAKEVGLLVGIPGQLYFLSISRVSDVYLDHINGQWVAWRERQHKGNMQLNDIKMIATGSTFDYVLLKIEKYLTFIKK